MWGWKLMKKQINCFSSFIIKIIAIVTMTIDHIGVAMNSFYPKMEGAIIACRVIGRFAMPLFAFMIVEGVLHTKNFKKYILKLGLLAIAISIGLIIAFYVPSLGFSEAAYAGNIFLDLILGALVVYCFKNKDIKIKLCTIPIIAFSVLSFIAKGFEKYTGTNFVWLPPYLRMQYDWLSIALMIGFFFSYYIADAYWEQQSQYSGIELDVMKGNNQYRLSVNIISMLMVLVIQLLYYFTIYINKQIVFWEPNIQICGAAAGVILLFYNGKRGYDSKWFSITSYLYYPVHIGIIFAIFYLVSLI